MKTWFNKKINLWRLASAIVCFVGVGPAAKAQGNRAAVQSDEFHVGDRIALVVEGPTMVSDTVVVRDGLVIRLPNMNDISLKGVRRADAQAYLTQEIRKYVKEAVVHATPLVQIAVLGAVGKPGYYAMPSDLVLTDVVMRAGGPAANSDVNRSVIRRGDKELLGKQAVAQALAQGKTLDQLQIEPGDQIVIGEKSSTNFTTLLQVTGAIVGIAGVALAVTRR